MARNNSGNNGRRPIPRAAAKYTIYPVNEPAKWGANLQKDDFGKNVLKCTYGGRFSNLSSAPVKGAGTSFRIQGVANESIYAVPSMECVMPVEGAYSAFAYTNGNYGSGTVYRGEDYRTFVLGFPLECVENTDVRTYLMQTIVQTLLSKKRR